MKETSTLHDFAEIKAGKICADIRQFIADNKVNKADLARLIGKNRQNINAIINGKRMLRIDTLILLISGLDKLTGVALSLLLFTEKKQSNATKTKSN